MATQIIVKTALSTILECTCGDDVSPGMLVIPTATVETPVTRGNLGVKVALADTVDVRNVWVVSLNVLGDTGGKFIDLQTYSAGNDLRVQACYSGDIIYVQSSTNVIALGSPVSIDIANPGCVKTWASGDAILGYALEDAADGFVKIACA
jgi:hypothetical protein